MEVKSGEGTVVVADRNRYNDECCNNRGWGSKGSEHYQLGSTGFR